MGLDELQQRLENHFLALRQQRTATVGGQPIFALEHGLPSEALTQLQQAVRAHISNGAPLKRHGLPWVVYAAEIGYRYVGDEYWQTFEAETPGWKLFGSRTWIRRRFEEFHVRFGGAKPTGRWAEWFSNICWPITHAILPRDLQRQLAKILYDSRYSFTRNLFDSPAQFGALIAARSWSASARFQKLAEQPLLLGQIATALLLDDQGNTSLILPSTLSRIATDLERERQARSWLLGARQYATRTQFRGLGASTPHPDRHEGGAPAESPHKRVIDDLGVEPRLIVQPAGPKEYEVFAEIPNLSPLLVRFPELNDILTGSRCLVTGAAGNPLWQGRVLRKSQLVRLATWPPAHEPLFKFERSNAILDYVLRTESFRRPGDQWLFRLASDGRGYEIRGMSVRPGGKYLLLTTELPQGLSASETAVHIQCHGVFGVEFELPLALDDDSIQRVKASGLSLHRALDVWPVGSPPATWDGEGRVEWLASDTAILAIRPDHPVQELSAVLDNDEWSRIQFSAVAAGVTLFIELPEMPAGSHRLTFRLRAKDRHSADESASLDIVVRAPHEWTPGVSAQGAFMVFIDPMTPSLEQLWEGSVAVEIHGPRGRQLTGAVIFKERHAEQPLVQLPLPPLPLPVKNEEWQLYFEKYVRRNKSVENGYDVAHSCVIELAGEELGRYSIEIEREFTPIRWALRRGRDCYELRVVNDTGDDGSLSVARYDMLHPESAVRLDPTSPSYNVPAAGGLFTATSDRFTGSILVPPFEIRSLEDLRARPDLNSTDHSNDHLIGLLSAAELWAAARFSGSDLLASIHRRNEVVDALLRAIVASVSGEDWRREEAIYKKRSDPGALSRLCQAITSKRSEAGLGVVLERDVSRLASLELAERVQRFTELIEKFLHVSNVWLCEYALRLASGDALVWAGEKLTPGFDQLRKHPAALRAARVMVLSVAECFRQGATEVGPVYAGWQWG